jgi:hypothetical protein
MKEQLPNALPGSLRLVPAPFAHADRKDVFERRHEIETTPSPSPAES